jgi:poly(hydroxyalkanoate) depolymerase family esterase
MKQFLERWIVRPLVALFFRLRSLIPRLRRLRRGRWISGDHRDVKGALFYAPFLPAKRPYRLYVPAKYDGVSRLPLMVMLHGCGQNPKTFAAGTRMNRIADKEGFLVLYPEQVGWANKYRCWNWFDPSAHNGVGEALLIAGMIRGVIENHAVDADHVYLAGLSAGGAMASILANCYGDLFAACAIHSGLMFRAAGSPGEATRAMKHGSRSSPQDAVKHASQISRKNFRPMPVIVFQGSVDTTVYPVNADQVLEQFLKLAEHVGEPNATTSRQPMRTKQVNGGYAYQVWDYLHEGRLLVRKVVVEGMGHAWSGGDARHPFNDPKGPDASRMIWEFFSGFHRHKRTGETQKQTLAN